MSRSRQTPAAPALPSSTRRAGDGFQFDPAAAVAHLRAADATLAAMMARVGAFTLTLQPYDSLFAALLRSIVFQQLHGKAAAAIHARVLLALAPHGGNTPDALARATDPELLGAGLSRAKLAALRDLAAKCQAGTVPALDDAAALSDDDLVARLTAVRGVGPWTVHMLLLFTLGRPDVLPTGDFAIRLAFRKLYRKRREPTPATIIRHARAWQPYRSVASWYLWRSLELR